LDILTEIAQTGFLNVVITIPTLDDDLRKKIEPRAPPLFPHISDSEEDMENLIKTLSMVLIT